MTASRPTILFAASCAALLTVSACAGGPQGGPPNRAQALTAQTDRLTDSLLTSARDLRNGDDCQEALPVYRQLAALGGGYEVAQSELAGCALATAATAGAADRELLVMEAVFWMERAAYAGEPSAQKRLSELYAGDGLVAEDGTRALSWALIYNANGRRDVLNLPSIERFELDKIENDLSSDARATAQAMASSFRIIKMAEYEPPARSRANERQRPEQNRASQRRRR